MFSTVKSVAQNGNGRVSVRKRYGSVKEHFVSATAKGSGSISAAMEDTLAYVKEHKLSIVSQETFSSEKDCNELFARFPLANAHWPVTTVCNLGSSQLAGVNVWAVEEEVAYLEADGKVVGSCIETDDYQLLRLGGLLPKSGDAGKAEQTTMLLEEINATLEQVGMSFANIVRTWFYNDDILSWYPQFNQARSTFFANNNINRASCPASTGIGGANPHGAALTAGVLAMKPKRERTRAFAVSSPLQDAASDYGSDFSRAMMLQAPKEKRLYVSGTASIDQAGLTVYQGDTYRQIEKTMAVVEAIIHEQKFSFSDVTMAVAYLPHHQDAQLFYDYCQKHLYALPVIVTLNTVCRDDLLFEIELEAIQSQ